MAWPPRDITAGSRGKPPIDRAVILLSIAALVVLVIAWQRGLVSVDTVILLIVFVPSVVLHEVSHGYIAKLFGDRTAERAGRLTLNPLRHVDVWGTFVIPLAISIAGGPPIGYAKPVPVDTSGMSRNRTMLTGLVGPFVNLMLWLLLLLVAHSVVTDSGPSDMVLKIMFFFGLVNLTLAVFNALPIPPLDGAAVVERFLPAKYWAGYLKFRQYSMFILLAVLLFFSGILGRVFEPFFELYGNLLPSVMQTGEFLE